MSRRRYTVMIADRSSGVMRQVTVSLRATVAVVVSVMTLPVLIGLGAKWSSRSEIDQLRVSNSSLTVENGSYRAATGELTAQIQSLESVIEDLGSRATLDPAQARAMAKLPAIVKTRAAGGSNVAASPAMTQIATAALTSPEDTFGVLRDLLQGLESRLRYVRRDVERREALASSTPSIWPAHGWLTGTFGGRSDPFSGEPAFHQGLDISTDKGQPVFATADGSVESATYTGDYGNLVVLRHGFGLSTRYGHMSGFNVKPGETVKRGAVIGFVGSTGRATGSHLHYEILVNGKLINPLQLLTQPPATR
jgi:murein DD-endopeptidase MepM/ murein hydrolase activator NlpD